MLPTDCPFSLMRTLTMYPLMVESRRPPLLTPYVQGLVLGVFEEESSVQLSEAAARFDQTLSGKLSELLKM